jgi:hypothetical protein
MAISMATLLMGDNNSLVVCEGFNFIGFDVLLVFVECSTAAQNRFSSLVPHMCSDISEERCPVSDK